MKQITPFFLVPLFFFAFSCKNNKDKYPAPPEDFKAGTFMIRADALKIGSEKYLADFGTIVLPENRNKSNSGSINIPFFRIHSKSENPAEPVFGLTGGPGQSNLNWDMGIAWTFLPERDFVLVGYRGVDGSSILDCPDITKAFKSENDPLNVKTLKTYGQAWSKAAGRLTEQGVDLEGYTMTETIEDIESVRKTLGYKQIDLLSESYGTRVAYLYGLIHPESIFRSAMISVNPPGHFVWEPREIDNQLKQYSALWSEDSIMSERFPDLYNTIRKVLENMPRKWLTVSINPGKVKVVTFSLLFQRTTAVKVLDAYTTAANGDASGLALMSLAYDFVVPSLVTWGDLASKAVSADFDSTRNYSSEMKPSTDMPLGSPLSMLLWGSLQYSNWPVKPIPEEYRKLQPSDVETLLLSGNIDFSTPVKYAANDLLPFLKNGKQIIFSDYGHVGDIWYTNIENTRNIIRKFYDTGIADETLATYDPVDFNVKFIRTEDACIVFLWEKGLDGWSRTF